MRLRAFLLLLLACAPATAGAAVKLGKLLQPAQVQGASLSPDGEHLLVRAPTSFGGEQLGLLRADTLQPVQRWTLGAGQGVREIAWLSDDSLAVQVGYRISSLDMAIAAIDVVYVMKIGNPEPRALPAEQGDHLLAVLEGEHPALLLQGWKNGKATLFRIDTETGERDVVASGPALGGYFVVDARGRPRYYVAQRYTGERLLFERVGGEWKKIQTGGAGGLERVPERMTADGRVFFRSITPAGRIGLEVFDPATAKFSWASRDPRYDLDEILTSADGREIVAAFYQADQPRYHFVHKSHPDTQAYKSLLKAFPGQAVKLVEASSDGNLVLLKTYSDRDPGQYFLYDRGKREARFLFETHDWSEPDAMVAQEPVRFTARDGLEIDAYLWRPAGEQRSGLPLVVRAHGGPHGMRETWRFDPEAQLLAANGYAVLTVNFRGSGGYGPAFESLGYRQWGGTMVDDLTDGARWAIAQGIAAGERLCVYGGSYGGYAALMSVVREPALYRCAVGYAGVYDIRTMYTRDRRRSTWMGRYFEDIYPETTDEKERQSPARRAGEIRAAVMLAHGGLDDRVPRDQYEHMLRALREAGHPAQVEVFIEYEGHGFGDPANQLEFYTKMLGFLDTHIGDRPAVSRKD